ncbi:MAG: hypothetical protein GY839_05700 [candidate division Zixibacteria bacterium]|nr:hypothetical protein [candidate division Zixibacteria bacterium]
MKKITVIIYFNLAVTLVAGMVAVAITLFRPANSTFRTYAKTEVIGAKLFANKLPSWTFTDVRLTILSDTTIEHFTGIVKPNSNVRFKAIRISNGPLWLTLSGDQGAVAQIVDYTSDVRFAASRKLSIKIPNIDQRLDNGESIALSIVGEIELGAEISANVEPGVPVPVLHSGSGNIYSERILGGTVFEAASYGLQMGDRFFVSPPTTKWESPNGVAAITCDHNPGLTTVLSAVGGEAWVTGYGRKAYPIRISHWDRLQNDPEVQALWLITGVFIAIWKLLARKVRAREKERGL